MIPPLRKLGALIRRFVRAVRTLEDTHAQMEEAKILAGDLLARQVRSAGVLPSLRHAEFKVFSQFGDDGIIQYLIGQVQPASDTFVEFGVGSYRESNTRFLLLHDNWRGLIMDCSRDAIESVRREPLYWRHDLTAVAAFITRENINDLLTSSGFAGEIGLLSIDIDGNDYWVWESIRAVRPEIVIVEYNSLWGAKRAVAVPYDASFERTRAHWSNQYWGCSLKALAVLAERKGYALVGSNSAGNNAYFVRKDRLGALRTFEPEDAYVRARYRDSRDPSGRLTFLPWEERIRLIADLPLVDVETGRRDTVGEILKEEGP